MSRIMVVDDDTDILKLCERVLVSHGHETIICSDAHTAVDILSKHNVDLLIVDVVMPVVNGFDLLRTVKKMKQTPPPVLMLTGRKSPQDVKTALELGATDYMVKPFDKDVFVAKVESILGRKASDTPEVSFASSALQTKAELVLSVQLMNINEMGMTFHSQSPVERNQRLVVNTTIFSEIGIPTPTLRAANCQQLDNGSYEIFVSFIGLDEFAMQKIRRWISQRVIAQRMSPAQRKAV